MKTEPISTKQVSLSKAARILSKFISADNGASKVIIAYLLRASASFSQLNQHHKEFKLLVQSNQKHKRHRLQNFDGRERNMENPIHRAEISQELSNGEVQSKNNLIRHQLENGNAGQKEEKLTETADKFSQAPDNAVGCNAENEGGIEKHKKKKMKQKVKSREHGDNEVEIGGRKNEGKLPMKAQKEDEGNAFRSVESYGEFIDGVGYDAGNEGEREKHKKRRQNESASWV